MSFRKETGDFYKKGEKGGKRGGGCRKGGGEARTRERSCYVSSCQGNVSEGKKQKRDADPGAGLPRAGFR